MGHGAFFSAGHFAGPERRCTQNRAEGAAISKEWTHPPELSRSPVHHLPIFQSANPLVFLLISTPASRILPMCLPIFVLSVNL